jgi:hypothetical protein
MKNSGTMQKKRTIQKSNLYESQLEYLDERRWCDTCKAWHDPTKDHVPPTTVVLFFEKDK